MSPRAGLFRRLAAVAIALVVCWLLVIAAVQAQLPDPGAAGEEIRRPDNPGPVIEAIHVNVDGVEKDRAEIEHDITVTAVVQESKTAVSHLLFNWNAPVGEIRGSGPSIVWHIPKGTATPVSPVLTLELVEQYPDFEAGLVPAMREHRTSADAPMMHINDSVAELTKMAHAFLVDYFGNSSVSPEAAVVDFHDNCKGKADEVDDIRINRARFLIHRATAHVAEIEFHPSMNSAYITAPCEFFDFERPTNREHTVAMKCLLTAVYEKPRWWLCDSSTASGTNKYLDEPASRALPPDAAKAP